MKPALLKELRKAAAKEGAPVNEFINVALAEKLARWETIDFFRSLAKRTSPAKFFEILDRMSGSFFSGNELPEDWKELAASTNKSRPKPGRSAVRQRK
jgi:hypothetical protein